METKIKVLIIEDHDLVRESLIQLLESTGSFCIVGEACSGKSALRFNKKDINIDLILLDLNLPDVNGLNLIPMILTLRPSAKIVILTMHVDSDMEQLALARGAVAYLTKNYTRDRFISSLFSLFENVNNKNGFVKKNVDGFSRTPFEIRTNDLTKRELQVIRLIYNGKTTREIAEKLCLSFRTVANHRNNILIKSGAKNMISLINNMVTRQQI